MLECQKTSGKNQRNTIPISSQTVRDVKYSKLSFTLFFKKWKTYTTITIQIAITIFQINVHINGFIYKL